MKKIVSISFRNMLSFMNFAASIYFYLCGFVWVLPFSGVRSGWLLLVMIPTIVLNLLPPPPPLPPFSSLPFNRFPILWSRVGWISGFYSWPHLDHCLETLPRGFFQILRFLLFVCSLRHWQEKLFSSKVSSWNDPIQINRRWCNDDYKIYNLVSLFRPFVCTYVHLYV